MLTDAEFLNWIADRFVNVHGESENVDFVQALRGLARKQHDYAYVATEEMSSLHMRNDLRRVVHAPRMFYGTLEER